MITSSEDLIKADRLYNRDTSCDVTETTATARNTDMEPGLPRSIIPVGFQCISERNRKVCTRRKVGTAFN